MFFECDEGFHNANQPVWRFLGRITQAYRARQGRRYVRAVHNGFKSETVCLYPSDVFASDAFAMRLDDGNGMVNQVETHSHIVAQKNPVTEVGSLSDTTQDRWAVIRTNPLHSHMPKSSVYSFTIFIISPFPFKNFHQPSESPPSKTSKKQHAKASSYDIQNKLFLACVDQF